MRILVTAGATREPIDAVRFLSNVSTGATGAALADALAATGHRVTLLHGTGAAQPARVRDLEAFTTAEDLRERLRRRLAAGGYGAVVMAAAVSDYRPGRVVRGKISSDRAALTVRLVRNGKILPGLKRLSPRALAVIGFKLTAGASAAARARAVGAQFAAGGVDAVVHNDLDELGDARRPHVFRLFRSPQAAPLRLAGAPALAAAVDAFLTQGVASGRPATRRDPRAS